MLSARRHSLPEDRHSLLADRRSFMADPQSFVGDRRSLLADRHSLPADRRFLPDDRRSLPADRHSFMEDRRLLMDDRHSLPEDRRSLGADDVYEASFKKHYVEAIVGYGRILGSSLFSVDWKKTHGALSGPGGAMKVADGKPRPQGEAHPPVSPMTPRAPAGRMTAHDGGSCRHFMRPAGSRKTLPCDPVRLVSPGFPPATFMRASSAKNFPQNHSTENSGEPVLRM